MDRLAHLILESASIREDSWSAEECRYTWSLRKAIRKAISNQKADPNWFMPVDLLLSYCWNDALDWAESVIIKMK